MNVNLDSIFQKMKPQSIGVVFSGGLVSKTADQSYPFQVNKNFFYATHINEDNLALVLVKGNKNHAILYTQLRSPERVKWEGHRLSFDTLTAKSGITDIRNIEALNADLTSFLSTTREAVYGDIHALYVDFNAKDRLDSYSVQFVKELMPLYPELKIESLGTIFKSLRTLKSPNEVSKMKEAIAITQHALEEILKKLPTLSTERDVEAEFLYHIHKHGATEAFDTIAASGANATILHYIENDAKLNKSDLILLDLGAQKDQYNSDISRTYPISGTFTNRQKQLYQMVLHVNKHMIAWIKPGYTITEFKHEGKRLLAEYAKEIGLIDNLEDISQYYYHGLGHHLGLDVHDICDYDQVITEGMILTVEPGIYIAEEHIGIRIEDDVLVTHNGAINLSESIIKEVDDIESYMKAHVNK